MQTITALIPARNEEKNISKCLESVKWCDRIVVISAGQDNTSAIAKKFGAIVRERKSSVIEGFVKLQENINEEISETKTDWILRVDADEVVTPELMNEIIDVLKAGKSDIVAYGIPRKQYFLGKFLKGGDWAYDRLTRLFRPQYCRYEPVVKVHEQFKVNGKLGYLKESLEHYSHPDVKTLFQKFDLYTTLESEALTEHKFAALIKLFFLPPYIFLRWVIYHHGYRDGLRGIRAGMMRAYYDVLLYSKYLINDRRNIIK